MVSYKYLHSLPIGMIEQDDVLIKVKEVLFLADTSKHGFKYHTTFIILRQTLPLMEEKSFQWNIQTASASSHFCFSEPHLGSADTPRTSSPYKIKQNLPFSRRFQLQHTNGKQGHHRHNQARSIESVSLAQQPETVHQITIAELAFSFPNRYVNHSSGWRQAVSQSPHFRQKDYVPATHCRNTIQRSPDSSLDPPPPCLLGGWSDSPVLARWWEW